MTGRIWVATIVAAGVLLFGEGLFAQHGQMKEEQAFDNDTVRVTLLTMPAGSATGIHINGEPELGIVVDGELTMVTRKGKEVFKRGRVVFLPTGTGHEALNETQAPVTLWALSLKKCQ